MPKPIILKEIENKVDKKDGFDLVSVEDAEKLSKLIVHEDGSVETSKEVDADNVNGLDDFVDKKIKAISSVPLAQKADKLTTSRNITFSGAVGGWKDDGSDRTVSFDGSKDVSVNIPLIKESYLTWGGKNFEASWGPIDAAMVPDFAANRLAFFSKEQVILESSKDSGGTWTVVDNDVIKAGLFAKGSAFFIGNDDTLGIDKSTYMLRVTITTTSKCYSTLNKFAIRISSNGSSGCYCYIDARTKENQDKENDAWVNFANKVPIAGWSGWNIINIQPLTTHGNNDKQYSQIRFTLGTTSHSNIDKYKGLQLLRIMAFGGEGWTTPSNMASDGHLYSYDSSQNAIFPAKVKATSFEGSLVGNAETATKATKDGNGAVIATTYAKKTDINGLATETYVNNALLEVDLSSRAPTDHTSTSTTYGVSTADKYGHAKASSTSPKAPGTAFVGNETASFARGDHVHPLQTSVDKATKDGDGNTISTTYAKNATTLAGYGITDAYTKTVADNKFTTAEQVNSIAATQLNTLIGGANDKDTITNVETLINYVNTKGSDTVALVSEVYGASSTTGTSRIDTLESKVNTLNGSNTTSGSVAKTVEDAINAKNLSQYAKSSELGTMAKETATNYIKKSEATGYNDILTKTVAQNTYQPKGSYYTKTEVDGKIKTAVETYIISALATEV